VGLGGKGLSVEWSKKGGRVQTRLCVPKGKAPGWGVLSSKELFEKRNVGTRAGIMEGSQKIVKKAWARSSYAQ